MMGLVFFEVSDNAVILCPQFIKGQQSVLSSFFLFFHINFVSRTLTIHRTAKKGADYLLNSSLHVPPTLKTLELAE